jgi:aminoglycoside phosphotransferase family enzyme/predicted kinase
MIVDDQAEVVKFLTDVRSYGLQGDVAMIETHISRIFLAGDRAFKLKRAVKLPYVDFSTPELRVFNCEREVALNAASTPGLYLGVRRIVRTATGELAFGATGRAIDAVVEMKRFDQSSLADRMAMAGELTSRLMTAMARMVVALHAAAPVVHAGGGAANIEGVLKINEAGFATSHVFDPQDVEELNRRFRNALETHAERLDRREALGKLRRCHGDLHLRNICVLDGVPYPFDCIEFNDQIANVDVLYDLAFLLMDLWHRGFRSYANLVANRYFDESDNEDGFVLLPFFMAVRAAVRAHVTATQAESSRDKVQALAAEARSYFSLATELLGERPPRLIAIGGLSGSGKSTIAEAVAPLLGMPPGARIVESDRIRKAMHGVSAETRLDAAAYRPEVSEKVYAEIGRQAAEILAAGGSVVADAVFDRPENRRMLADAVQHHARFDGFWLDLPPDKLRDRVARRPRGPSDADLAVLDTQLARSPGPIEWRRLDAGRSICDLAEEMLG